MPEESPLLNFPVISQMVRERSKISYPYIEYGDLSKVKDITWQKFLKRREETTLERVRRISHWLENEELKSFKYKRSTQSRKESTFSPCQSGHHGGARGRGHIMCYVSSRRHGDVIRDHKLTFTTPCNRLLQQSQCHLWRRRRAEYKLELTIF